MTLTEAKQIAQPGQFIVCDVFGHVLRITSSLTNGLGTIYRKNTDGTVSRYVF